MKTERITLKGIPALLIGEPSHKVYLYVHGKMGSKEEALAFAEQACPAGYQVLAIDLPEHGERKNGPERLLPWVVVPELQFMDQYARVHWRQVSLRATSIGAWFSMLALQEKALRRALCSFRPIVDMEDPHRQDDAAGQRDRRAAASGRGDPHELSGRRFRGRISAGCGSIRSAGAPPRRCSMAKLTS